MDILPRFFQAPAQSCFLFGPRGTGKSTWLRRRFPEALYVDLLDPALHRRPTARPERLQTSAGRGMFRFTWTLADSMMAWHTRVVRIEACPRRRACPTEVAVWAWAKDPQELIDYEATIYQTKAGGDFVRGFHYRAQMFGFDSKPFAGEEWTATAMGSDQGAVNRRDSVVVETGADGRTPWVHWHPNITPERNEEQLVKLLVCYRYEPDKEKLCGGEGRLYLMPHIECRAEDKGPDEKQYWVLLDCSVERTFWFTTRRYLTTIGDVSLTFLEGGDCLRAPGLYLARIPERWRRFSPQCGPAEPFEVRITDVDGNTTVVSGVFDVRKHTGGKAGDRPTITTPTVVRLNYEARPQ